MTTKIRLTALRKTYFQNLMNKQKWTFYEHFNFLNILLNV